MFKLIFLHVIATVLFAEHLITPIPLTISYDKEKALLGKELFWEKRLSPNRKMACIDCHNLLSKKNPTTKEKNIKFSVPTVLNAVYNYKFFGDGRVNSLEEQVKETLESGFSAKGDKKIFMQLLETKYKKKFKQAYKDGFLFKNIVDALVEFQRTLTTPNSKFDRYLRGEKEVLSEKELAGYEVFKSRGCMACHNGTNLGANFHSKLEIPSDNGKMYKGCYGRTKNNKKHVYAKVPSLRNITLTGPYFHDGSVSKLEDAIQGASTLALKNKLSTRDINSLTLFLKTFEGERPAILEEKLNEK